MIISDEYLKLCRILHLLVKSKYPDKIKNICYVRDTTWYFIRGFNYYCLICDNLFFTEYDSYEHFNSMAYNHVFNHIKDFNLINFI